MEEIQIRRWFWVATSVGCLLLSSCGGDDEISTEGGKRKESVEKAPIEMSEAVVKSLPGALHRYGEQSAIHWHPWSKESFDLAEQTGRLVLVLVDLPQYSNPQQSLDTLTGDGEMARIINEFYIPVLADADTARELGVYASYLSSERSTPFQMPLLFWMSSERNLVSWSVVPSGPDAVKAFSASHNTVAEILADGRDYVYENSQFHQVNRRERVQEIYDRREYSDDPEADVLKALRQITSLYDSFDATFDGTGGLFPTATLRLLAVGSKLEAIPEDLRERSREVLGFLMPRLLNSPMFDPLDGGVFNSKVGSSWYLPSFQRDCASQARVAVSLIEAHGVAGGGLVLERALQGIEFAESEYRDANGLFFLTSADDVSFDDWLWTIDEVKAVLTEEEAVLWVQYSGMKELGNLLSDTDLERKHFRKNTLQVATDIDEMSRQTGIGVEVVRSRIASAKQKLLAARLEKLGEPVKRRYVHCGASLEMVKAYTAAYRVTGKQEFLDKAVLTLSKIREHFSLGPKLRLYVTDAFPSLVEGRAVLYATALQTVLDVYAASQDEQWLLWADDLTFTLAEWFMESDRLHEVEPSSNLLGMLIIDDRMLYESSTYGLMSMVEAKMKALGRPLPQVFHGLFERLPKSSVENPLPYVEQIEASLFQYYGTKLYYGADTEPNLERALSRVSPYLSTSIKDTEKVSEFSQAVIEELPDGTEKRISEVSQIDDYALQNEHE